MMWNLKVACTFFVQIMNYDPKQLMTPHLRKLHAILRFHLQLYENYTQLSKLRNTYRWKLHAKSWKFRVKSKNLRATFQIWVYFSKVPCKFQKFVAKSCKFHATFKSPVQFLKVACKKSKFTCNFQKFRAIFKSCVQKVESCMQTWSFDPYGTLYYRPG